MERKRLEARKADLHQPDRAESAAARKPVHPEGGPSLLSTVWRFVSQPHACQTLVPHLRLLTIIPLVASWVLDQSCLWPSAIVL